MSYNVLLLVPAVVLVACAFDIAGPQSSLEGLPAGLEVSLTVEPDTVSQHAPFAADLTVTNTMRDSTQVVTVGGCLAVPHVLRNGKRIPFEGSDWVCSGAVTSHTFAPGETRTRTWDMRAELYRQNPDDVDGAPAPKGTYRLQAEFDIYPRDGSGQTPVVERQLHVR